MILTIGERLTLGGVLPEKGNVMTMTRAKNMRSRIELTEDEADQYELMNVMTAQGEGWRVRPRLDDDGVEMPVDLRTAKSFLDIETEVDIKDSWFEMTAQRLVEIDAAKQITERQLPLYQKFVQDPKDAEREGLHEVTKEASA